MLFRSCFYKQLNNFVKIKWYLNQWIQKWQLFEQIAHSVNNDGFNKQLKNAINTATKLTGQIFIRLNNPLRQFLNYSNKICFERT